MTSHLYKKHTWRYLGLLFLVLTQTACLKKPPVVPPVSAAASGTLIICEGSFNNGNGSLSWYNNSTQKLQNDVFGSANGYPLGDVVQSVYFYNAKLYAVVNNSGKIVAIDTATFKAVNTLNGLPSPRYLLSVGDHKAYVTNFVLNGNTVINVVDLATNTLLKTLPTRWCEQLVQAPDGGVWTGVMRTNMLLRLDPLTDRFTDTVRLSDSPQDLQIDKNGDLWVACTGSFVGDTPTLTRINTATRQIVQTFGWAIGSGGANFLRLNANRDTLYYANDQKIWRMPITATTLPTQPLIVGNWQYLYGLGIAPRNGEIWVADAKDFTQNGSVFRYKNNGTPINILTTGIAPSGFWFK